MLITVLLSAAGFAVITAALVRYCRPAALAVAVSLLLPVLSFPLTFALAANYATCSDPDCGPLIFVAVGVFAVLVTIGGLVGAGIALLAHGWWKSRSAGKA